MARQQIVEGAYVAVIRESEVADASGFSLFQQEVDEIVLEEALHQCGESFAHAYDVEQVVVDVVGLQILE